MHKAIRNVLKRRKWYPPSMTSKQAYAKVLKNPIDLRWFVRRIDEAEGDGYKTIHLVDGLSAAGVMVMDMFAPTNTRLAVRRVRQRAKARGVKL